MSTSSTRGLLTKALVALAALAFLFSLYRWATQEPAASTDGTALDPAGLDSLQPYLGPARPLPPWMDERTGDAPLAAMGPARPDPWQPPPVPPAPEVPVSAQEWTVSAILLGPGRRVAVLNDRQVRTGDVVTGGVRVAAIEADRVVLQGPNGERQVVWLNQPGES